MTDFDQLPPQLPAAFKDYLTERNKGVLPSKELVKYCSKVLFHQQWSILLDKQLVDAMKDGLVMGGPDGERHCFYPRVFTYSADYPERCGKSGSARQLILTSLGRILIAGIRNYGGRPCHRCLTKDSELGDLGSPIDAKRRSDTRCEANQAQLVKKAHHLILRGTAVTGKKVEALMKEESLVPVQVRSFSM